MEKSIGSLSREIYTDPANPDSFSHPLKILRQIRSHLPPHEAQDVKLEQVERGLARLPAYSRFKSVRKTKRSMVTRSDDVDERWQVDLMNVQSFDPSRNQGFSFLLYVIDVFSRHLMVVPLHDKSSEEVSLATELIFMTQGRIPKSITSDSGAEFKGRPFKTLCKKYGIQQFFTIPNITHASVVERVIRTMRHRIGKYLVHNKTPNFIRDLGALVTSYNNSVHSSIGMTPHEARSSIANRQLAMFFIKNRQRYGGSWKTFLTREPKQMVHKRAPPAEGVAVRLPILRRRFNKAHEPPFSSSVYRIANVFVNDRNNRTSRIQQPNISTSEPVSSKHHFYPSELSRVE